MTARTAIGTVGSGIIVLAEDDIDIRDLAMIVLEGVGLSVIAVCDGAEALPSVVASSHACSCSTSDYV